MDSFLEEIKKEQQHREQKYSRVAQSEGISVSAMAAWEKNRGSHDIGDSEPLTFTYQICPMESQRRRWATSSPRLGL
jgi:hypothetical protein